MLWIAIEFPHFPLDLFARGLPDAQQRLIAIHNGDSRRPCITHATAAAQRVGVRRGMPVSAACSLSTELQCLERNPDAEEQALERLATCCYQYSSQVSLGNQPGHGERPATLLLEAAASERLFGPAETMGQHIGQQLAQQGWQNRHGAAPTPEAARLAASNGWFIREPRELGKYLHPLPLEQLPLDTASRKTIRGVGLRTLGDVLRLPRKALTRRLGPAVTDYLDRLLGHRPDPLLPYHPPGGFSSWLELPAETTSNRALRFPLQRLLRELSDTLYARDAATATLCLQLETDDGKCIEVSLSPRQPLRDAGHFQELLQERLERLRLVRPVRRMGLEVEQLLPFSTRQEDLFGPTAEAAADISQLCDRLEARLGASAIRVLGGRADHRPERSGEEHPSGTRPQAIPQAHRPNWLLDQATPCDIGAYRILAGPERIESGWWDGNDCRRDYFIVEDAGGSLMWAYRAYKPRPGWYLHGLFG